VTRQIPNIFTTPPNPASSAGRIAVRTESEAPMDVTEVRLYLENDGHSDRLRAFVSVMFDGFVVRDIKLIERDGVLSLAFPSRKLTDRCPRCDSKTVLDWRHCPQCGGRLESNRVPVSPDGRVQLFHDIAHPADRATRDAITAAVVAAYREVLAAGAEPHVYHTITPNALTA
jgi:stage V sporulation protein G